MTLRSPPPMPRALGTEPAWLELLADGVALVDGAGSPVQANARALALLGASRLRHRGDLESALGREAMAWLEQARRSGAAVPAERRVVTAGGVLGVQCAPFDGDAWALVLRPAAEAGADGDDLAIALMALPLMPIPATVQDERFRLVAVNAAFCEFAGLAAERLIGRDPIELQPADTRPDVLASRRSIVEGAEDEWRAAVALERRMVDATGRERRFRVNGRRLRCADGRWRLLAILHETTDEHRVRQQVDRSLAELERWFSLVPAGLIVVDGQGRVMRSNPALHALLGAVPAELQQADAELQALLAWVPPDGGGAGVPPVERQVSRIGPDGRTRRLIARCQWQRSEGGAPVMLAVVEDRSAEDERDLARLEMGALMDTAGVGVATFDESRGWLPGREGQADAARAATVPHAISRDMVLPPSLPEYERLQLALRRGDRAEVRYAVRHPELGVRWLQTRVEPGWLSSRRTTSVVTIDVTDRELAREQLVLQAERTRAILDSVLVGIVTVGPEGIEWMNRSARRMFGGDLGDFFGQPIATVATPEPEHPLRRTDYLESLDEGRAESFECRLTARDGREFWVVGNVVVTGRDSTGRQLTFALLDIERRRQAEMRIAQAQQSLQRIIETVPLAIGLFDGRTLRLVQVNQTASAFLGRAGSDAVGCNVGQLFGDDADTVAADMAAARATQAPSRRELPRGTAESARLWELRFVPLAAGDDGTAAADQLVMVAVDVTEQRAAERARLEAAVAQRDMLVKEVHHRIKNNLQGVAGLMQQVAVRRPEVAPVITEAIGQVQAIAQVYGLQVGAAGPLRVRSVIEAIAGSVQRMFGRPIAVAVAGGVAHRWALPEAESIPIALTVNELLTNAIKHGGPGPVACELDFGDAQVTISVTNEGQLPAGFDLARVPGGVSGLGLVRALLPRRHARLSITQAGGMVQARIVLVPPGVALLEPL